MAAADEAQPTAIVGTPSGEFGRSADGKSTSTSTMYDSSTCKC